MAMISLWDTLHDATLISAAAGPRAGDFTRIR
jgi:hypothetical protein